MKFLKLLVKSNIIGLKFKSALQSPTLFAHSKAVASPIPAVAPVITTILPSNLWRLSRSKIGGNKNDFK